jgi:hypothetical protein
LAAATKTANDAIELAEKSGLKSAKGSAILSLATVQEWEAAADFGKHKEALATAKKAQKCFQEVFDAAGEGMALTVIGNVNKELFLAAEQGSDEWKQAYQGTFRSSKEAVRLMKAEGGGNTEALATASMNVAMFASIGQKPKDGLGAAKDAVDIFEELGDEQGLCMSMCYLAELHVLAGSYEDWNRLAMYLPMASSHSAAAGYWAEKAYALCEKTNFGEGKERMGWILTHERVVKDAGKRSVQFDYSSWADNPTCK